MAISLVSQIYWHPTIKCFVFDLISAPSTPSCFTPFPSNQNGPCQLTTQWYFTSTRCLSFSYTGCDKNAYFSSEPACVSACGGQGRL